MTEKQSSIGQVVRELTEADIAHLEELRRLLPSELETTNLDYESKERQRAKRANRNYHEHRHHAVREMGQTSIWVYISDAAQLVGESLLNLLENAYSRRSRLDTPPGCQLNSLARFVYPKKTYDRVFAPLIADVQVEYIEALDQGQLGKAQWIRWRGRAAFWTAVIARVPVAFAAWVKTALKSAGS